MRELINGKGMRFEDRVACSQTYIFSLYAIVQSNQYAIENRVKNYIENPYKRIIW